MITVIASLSSRTRTFDKLRFPNRMNLLSNPVAQMGLTADDTLNERLVAPGTALTTLF